ncbi:MAG: dual specificity protein phosphatase family protein [Bacteriovorax sp.]|nr:dual specificity protein phosphatase family protein [Bacteriovorax sp.]
MFTLLLNFLLIANVQAGLVSTMPSTYLETGIPNSHLVTKNVIRGMAPRNSDDIDTLINLGVTDFLIFKIDTNGDVEKEISMLEEKGVNKKNITHLEFPWKDITDFKPVCEMTIDALKTIEDAENNNRKVFFHCTVGEDRTGYLAGLYKIYHENINIEDSFVNELCDKGYEAGNPKKGMNVVMKVRKSLTPAFLTMVDLINETRKNKKLLSKKLCTQSEFNSFSPAVMKNFICKKSKLIH